ncbi:uncharacterized protein LOC105773399 [Gossypium raimondii]|uniref:Plant basic secretory protein (BSP) family protein n=1 Tax=Gossypium raimondii TaxID=29730 RepID=A0A0D2M572_GOSRA|nr:uncharacterized protein LOC105773399 [Gossypium raimondii]KJB12282.1 hypothetical protein B456_002G009600 [Gossypium raimondii]
MIHQIKQTNQKMANHPVFFLVYLLALATSLHSSTAVDYTVTNEVPTTPGGTVFDKELGVEYTRQQMESASQFIWNLFRQPDPASRKNVQSVSLFIVDNLDERVVALASNNNINVSDKSIQGLTGDELKRSFNGVLYHEMTHIWQWNGNGQIGDGHLGGLTEGIADFVRLKADYVPGEWPRPGDGEHWYDGYAVTAYFLDYCEGLKSGFVAELNAKLKDGYSPDFFFQILGKTVDQLWTDYKNIPRT